MHFTTLAPLGPVAIAGNLTISEDFSAVDRVGDHLILANDESNALDILTVDGDGYKFVRTSDRLDDSPKEIDIEGLASEGRTVYVVGSHACVRKEVDADDTYQDNRKRITSLPKEKPDRRKLIRFTLDAAGNVTGKQVGTLEHALKKYKILELFTSVASKENGVDIEGLAVVGGRLYVGFRGPVLRGNFVPVLVCGFDDPTNDHNLVFVNLDGRGVRDLARLADGFLILAGPACDGDGSYRLYHWDGHDTLPGTDRGGIPLGECRFVCELPPQPGRKAEGLTVIDESATGIELLVVYDGVVGGGVLRYRLS